MVGLELAWGGRERAAETLVGPAQRKLGAGTLQTLGADSLER